MADVYTKEGALQPELNLDMSWLDKDVRRWCTTKGKEALESGSTALDVFRKRSSVSAFRVASLCYYLYQLEAKDQPSLSLSLSQKRTRRIYLFMSDYILDGLLGQWGKQYKKISHPRSYPQMAFFFNLWSIAEPPMLYSAI